MKEFKYISVLFLCFSVFGMSAQSVRDLKSSGDEEFEAGNYCAAKENYDNYYSMRNNDLEVTEKLAICNFHCNDIENAQVQFTSLLNRQKKVNPRVYFFRAMIFHSLEKWGSAIDAYKLYLADADDDDPYYDEAILRIKQAANGKKEMFKPKIAYIENPEEGLNSISDDFHPVLSPTNPNKIYISSNREGSKVPALYKQDSEIKHKPKSDIWSIEKNPSGWQNASILGNLINSSEQDELMSFNQAGQILYYTKGDTPFDGELLSDTFSLDERPVINRRAISLPFDPDYGDKDLFFINENTILFSAIREEGYGGYDLYIAAKQNGTWSEIRNLGPEINSPFHERSPHLLNNLSVLFYSSNSDKSIGGYDVFSADWDNGAVRFENIKNLGLPINSAGDELHFTLDEANRSAFFSSNDKKNSLGGYDIFKAYFKGTISIGNAGELGALSNMIKGPEVAEAISENGPPSVNENQSRATISIKPLIYGDDEVILKADNIKTLKKLEELMDEYPESQLHIRVWDDFEGERSRDLFFSLKRGMEISRYLVKNGVPNSRIQTTAFGSAYKKASPVSGTFPLSSVKNLNKRIDLVLHNGIAANESFHFKMNETDIPKGYSDREYREIVPFLQGLSYRIQILATGSMYSLENIKNEKYILVDNDADTQTMKYTVGLFQRYDNANSYRNFLLSKGLKGCFIVPYIDGMRKSNFELGQYVDQYQDLNNFLD